MRDLERGTGYKIDNPNEIGAVYPIETTKMADKKIKDGSASTGRKPPKLTSDKLFEYLQMMGGEPVIVKPDVGQYSPDRKGRVNVGDRMTTSEKFANASDVGLNNEFTKLPEIHTRFDDPKIASMVAKEMAAGNLTVGMQRNPQTGEVETITKQFDPIPSRGNTGVRMYGLQNDPDARYLAFNKPEEAYKAPLSYKELQAEQRRLAKQPAIATPLEQAYKTFGITNDISQREFKLALNDDAIRKGLASNPELLESARLINADLQSRSLPPDSMQAGKQMAMTPDASQRLNPATDTGGWANAVGEPLQPQATFKAVPKNDQFFMQRENNSLSGSASDRTIYDRAKLRYESYQAAAIEYPDSLKGVDQAKPFPTLSDLKKQAKSEGIRLDGDTRAFDAYTNAKVNELTGTLKVPDSGLPATARLGQEYILPKTGNVGTVESVGRQGVKLNVGGEQVKVPFETLQKLKYTGNKDYGFASAPALRPALMGFAGGTVGAIAFKQLAKAVGLNEEQQSAAAGVGGLTGSFTAGALSNFKANTELRIPTAREFAGVMMGAPTAKGSAASLLNVAATPESGMFMTAEGRNNMRMNNLKQYDVKPALSEAAVLATDMLTPAPYKVGAVPAARMATDSWMGNYEAISERGIAGMKPSGKGIGAAVKDFTYQALSQFGRSVGLPFPMTEQSVGNVLDLMPNNEQLANFAARARKTPKWFNSQSGAISTVQMGLFDPPDNGRFPLKKIISGGQTGADKVGLEVAKSLGLGTGGFAPPRFINELGQDLSLRDDFGLTETKSFGNVSAEYAQRTRQNAKGSDGTAIFSDDVNSRGTKLTIAEVGKKPLIINPSPNELRDFIQSNQIETLNVAGNRASKAKPDFSDRVRATLTDAISPVLPKIDESMVGRSLVTGKGNIVQYEGDRKFQLPDLSIRQVDDAAIGRMNMRKYGDLGFGSVPALRPALRGFAGGTVGAIAFKQLAKAAGLNEEQQSAAAGVGGLTGSFTAGALSNFKANTELRIPTAREFAGVMLGTPTAKGSAASLFNIAASSESGAVYAIGGSRNLVDAPEIVKKGLADAIAGDKTPYFVLGDAKGADATAKKFAIDNGIPFRVMPADRADLGNFRFVVRDYEVPVAAKQIAETGAFGKDVKGVYFSVDGSKGTQHMINAVMEAGIPAQVTLVKSNVPAIPSVSDPNLSSTQKKFLDDWIAAGKDPSTIATKDFAKGVKPTFEVLGTEAGQISKDLRKSQTRLNDIAGAYQVPEVELAAMRAKSLGALAQPQRNAVEPMEDRPISKEEFQRKFGGADEIAPVAKSVETTKPSTLFERPELQTPEQKTRRANNDATRAYLDNTYGDGQLPDKNAYRQGKVSRKYIDKLTPEGAAALSGMTLSDYKKANEMLYKETAEIKTPRYQEAQNRIAQQKSVENKKYFADVKAWNKAGDPSVPMPRKADYVSSAKNTYDFAGTLSDAKLSAKQSSGGFGKRQPTQSTFIAESEVQKVATSSGASESRVKAGIAKQRATGEAPDLAKVTAAIAETRPQSKGLAIAQPQTLKQMQSQSKELSTRVSSRQLPDGQIVTPSQSMIDAGMKSKRTSSLSGLGILMDTAQAAQVLADSANRGENAQTAATRAGLSVGAGYAVTALGGSQLAAKFVPNAYLRTALQIGGGIAAVVGADKAIDQVTGRDEAKEQKYSKDLSKLGLDITKESETFKPFANDDNLFAAYGNSLSAQVQSNLDYRPAARAIANLANKESIDNARYMSERDISRDASRDGLRNKSISYRELGNGVTEGIMRQRPYTPTEYRILALQNLANEYGYEVPRTGKFDPKLTEALDKLGYRNEQISDYMAGRLKNIGKPKAKVNASEYSGSINAERTKAPVTSAELSRSLSAERKSLGLKANQQLSDSQVDGVFKSLTGGRTLAQMRQSAKVGGGKTQSALKLGAGLR